MADFAISNQLAILLAVNSAALFPDNWLHTRHSLHFCDAVSIYYIHRRLFFNNFSLLSQSSVIADKRLHRKFLSFYLLE